ncbi:Golgin candidate 5, partial [Mucuna pruriens]
MAKEAEALVQAHANNEARTELESCLREAEEHESMLVQALEELRKTLSRREQQEMFKEDMLRKDIEDLQKQSTRSLLRQIEAMQETNARRVEAWTVVERTLNSRLQEAEAKAATAEERERSVNERLSQTLSRVNVLEAQISCLRAEQTQLSRTLEKESTKIHIDNKSAQILAKSPVFHERSKHIDTRYHFIKECIVKKEVELVHVKTQDQVVDIFTKPLKFEDFRRLRARLGV